MDALSDLLRVVRFSGGLFLEANFRLPWCLRAQVTPNDCGPGVKANGGLAAFHYVLDGRLQVQVGKEKARIVRPGGIILLPQNDPHLLGSDVGLPPMDPRPLMCKAEAHELARIDYGTGRQVKNRFVCGFLATTIRENPLLRALPRLLIADLRGRPCTEWAETSFRYAAREHAARRPGSQEILGRLSEMLFVEAVRGYMETLPGDATGWLAALRDRSLSIALGAMHARPEHAWTAEELAKMACLSRSAFAERFANTVGVPPMGYLTRWRMLVAGNRLRESSDTIAQVAATVGYESEFTFSRAFSREMGVAPGAWRRHDRIGK
jgi:AraC-like DNA-binding protein